SSRPTAAYLLQTQQCLAAKVSTSIFTAFENPIPHLCQELFINRTYAWERRYEPQKINRQLFLTEIAGRCRAFLRTVFIAEMGT
ncbi:hypothetical protein, partial [Marinicauda pacifica]|uniref:hypothetical protein n=1 Tax=Marinicauda pacifica TaxID=1133559 RepID=UPI0035C82B83